MNRLQLFDRMSQGLSIREQLQAKVDRQGYEVSIKNYHVLEYLSKGAFGSVYKGFDVINKREVAIKLIDIDEMYAKNQNEQVRQKLKRYLRTQEILLKKCHSANVIKLYDVIENQRCKILVLEYCSEGALDFYIKTHGPVDENDAIVILRQIILGLAELHRNRIIHRDLKPPNILIHNGVFKLADFGFAKEIQSQNVISEGTRLGSRNTMAPEVKNNEPYGLKADIWSLGMIFFIMIYGDRTVDYHQRHDIALKIVREEREFNFKLANGQKISKEAADFLNRTLVVDQKSRLNWQRTLDHPLFKKKTEKMSSILIPCDCQKRFDQLGKDLIPMDKEPQFRNEFQGMERLNEEYQRLPRHEVQKYQVEISYAQLNRQYLQCRKSEFIFNSMVLPLQRQQLLQLDCRKHIQLLLLLCVRCSFNVSYALSTVKRVYAGYVYQHFETLVDDLSKKVYEKRKDYFQRLQKIESQVSQIIKDKFTKLVSSNAYRQKQKYLVGIEGMDFSRQDQIRFTYEKYLVDVINELKGNRRDEERMKSNFKAYRQINEIKFQDLQVQNLDARIQEIIKELE